MKMLMAKLAALYNGGKILIGLARVKLANQRTAQDSNRTKATAGNRHFGLLDGNRKR